MRTFEWQDRSWKLARAIEQRRLLIQEQVEKEDLYRWAMREEPEVEPEVLQKTLPVHNLRWHPPLFKRLVGFAQI